VNYFQQVGDFCYGQIWVCFASYCCWVICYAAAVLVGFVKYRTALLVSYFFVFMKHIMHKRQLFLWLFHLRALNVMSLICVYIPSPFHMSSRLMLYVYVFFLLYRNRNAIAFQYPVTCIIPSIDSGSNFNLPLFVL